MKRGKKMLLLLCSLLVLIGINWGIQKSNKNGSAAKTSGTFSLINKTVDDLVEIAWKKDGNNYSFIRQDGVWKTQDEPGWPVRQDLIQGMAEKFIKLQSGEKIENVKNPADYGFETPAFSVTVKWADSEKVTFNMGSSTPFSDGFYVMSSENANTVYTVSSSLETIFKRSKAELLQMEDIPVVMNAVRLTVGNSLDAVKQNESHTMDPEQFWYEASSNTPLDGTQIEKLVKTASEIKWKELVSAQATENELKDWKLDDESSIKLTVSGDDGNSRIILFGNQKENSGYYARLPHSSMVYIIESDPVSSLLSSSVDTVWCRSVLPLPYDKLSSAEFITEKGKYTIEKMANSDNSKEEKAEDAENELSAKPNETQKTDSDEAWRKLWDLVTSLKATDRIEDQKKENQIMSIHAVNSDGKETTVIIQDYSVESYQAIVDGGLPLLVPADNIDLLVRTVRSMQ